MTVLHLMIEGALAAAEMLVLLFVPAASAAEPVAIEAQATLERPVHLHRLSTAVDVRLLGSLADVRVIQHLRNDGTASADLASHLPVIDEQVDALRIVRTAGAIDLLAGGDCGDTPAGGHVRLSDDEAIADALHLAPGADAVIEVIATHPLVRRAGAYELALPLAVDLEAPRATLVDHGDSRFLLVVPHRRAARSTLVLRPAAGASQAFDLGRVDPRLALLVPLSSRAQLDSLAAGAIELELDDGATTHWVTLVADRVEESPAVQAQATE